MTLLSNFINRRRHSFPLALYYIAVYLYPLSELSVRITGGRETHSDLFLGRGDAINCFFNREHRGLGTANDVHVGTFVLKNRIFEKVASSNKYFKSKFKSKLRKHIIFLVFQVVWILISVSYGKS